MFTVAYPLQHTVARAWCLGNELLIVDKKIGGNKRLPLLTSERASKKHRRMFLLKRTIWRSGVLFVVLGQRLDQRTIDGRFYFLVCEGCSCFFFCCYGCEYQWMMGAGNSFCFFSIAHRMGLLGLKNDKVGALYDIWVFEQNLTWLRGVVSLSPVSCK
jgi:hypothetical protein